MSIFDCPQVFDEEKQRVYTVLVTDENGVQRSAWGGLTVQEMVDKGEISPNYRIVSPEEGLKLQDAAYRKQYCKGVSEISRSRYWELLEVLFPADWRVSKRFESFRVPECIAGDLYTWCAKLKINGKDRYFTCVESSAMTQPDFYEKVMSFVSGD
jgi:hypothetical protein